MSSGVKVSKLNFELNPRGNLWFNDESTFGHKLLSKMGWSKGKGLGKNEDGIKENIKISKKETNTGVGWKHDDIPVAVGCLEYENILQNLQKQFNKHGKSTSGENFEKSLEQRSRNARNHLHYQKFVRGKDLMRYSEKDMKSIFLEKPKKPVSNHPSRPPQDTPTFNSQLSVNDYFALKMQKKKDEVAKLEANHATERNNSSQLHPVSRKLFTKQKFVSESPGMKANVTAEAETISDPISEKPSKKQKFVSQNPETKVDVGTENVSSESQPVNKKLSKKRKFVSESTTASTNVCTEYDISSQSQLIIEQPFKRQKFISEGCETEASEDTFFSTSRSIHKKSSKKQKFVSESNEIETSKAKFEKENSDHDPSNSPTFREDESLISDETPKIKKKKKSKKNKSRLQELKSCLKSRGDYDFEKTRNVSFSEQVSYKILDTSLELCEEINDLHDGQDVEEVVTAEKECVPVSSSNEEPENEGLLENDCSTTNGKGVSSKGEDNSASEEEVGNGPEDLETPPCFDLPKSSGSNFNFWLESQRQATKMKLYKQMAKKIRKDKRLCTSNLLDIKGYGNWSL